MSGFGHRNENREDWLNIDTIRIPYQIIYCVNSIYYKNPTEFFRNRDNPSYFGAHLQNGCIAGTSNSDKVWVSYGGYTISESNLGGGILHLRYKNDIPMSNK